TAAAARRSAVPASEPAAPATVAPWPIAGQPQTEGLPSALSYAAQPTPLANARTLSMGAAHVVPPAPEPLASKRGEERLPAAVPLSKAGRLVHPGDQFDDPWLRAMIVSPS